MAHELRQMAQPLRNRLGKRDIGWHQPQGNVVGQAQRYGRVFQGLTQVVRLDQVDAPGCGRLVLCKHPAVCLQHLFHRLARSEINADSSSAMMPMIVTMLCLSGSRCRPDPARRTREMDFLLSIASPPLFVFKGKANGARSNRHRTRNFFMRCNHRGHDSFYNHRTIVFTHEDTWVNLSISTKAVQNSDDRTDFIRLRRGLPKEHPTLLRSFDFDQPAHHLEITGVLD
jgi:hypothetical protein